MNSELLVRTLHGSSTGYWSLRVAAFSAAPCVTEQPNLGNALLTSKEEGPRKGGLKIAHSIHTWTGYCTCRVIPPLAVEIKIKTT